MDLTPCAVKPSGPIMPPIRDMDMPCRVGEEVWGKVHAAGGDSGSLLLPSAIDFRGFRESVWRPRPGMTPPGELDTSMALLIFCLSSE